MAWPIGAFSMSFTVKDIPSQAGKLAVITGATGGLGYETALAGKMHFIGEQLHGYEKRLTSDIYPADYGWRVNWDEPDRRLEWYHNASSILQAGPCVRSNQLDYDEEVMYKSSQFLYDHVRQGEGARPFCLTVCNSFTPCWDLLMDPFSYAAVFSPPRCSLPIDLIPHAAIFPRGMYSPHCGNP